MKAPRDRTILLFWFMGILLGGIGGAILVSSFPGPINVRQVAAASPAPSPTVTPASSLPPLLDKPMSESESDYVAGKGEIKELLEEERAARQKEQPDANLDFLDKLPIVFQATVVCFDLLKDIDTYESVACSCDAAQVPAPLHRKIAAQTRALNAWVKSSTVWKGRTHWVKERR